MSLGYVIDCLVRDELDIKYYIFLGENELKRIYYGGDYHIGSPNPKVKQSIYCFHCLLFAIVCSILVVLWQGHPLHKGPMGGWHPKGCCCWLDNKIPFLLFPMILI